MSKKRIQIAQNIELPEGFVREMKELLGEEEAGKLTDSLNMQPSVSIRVNRKKVASPEEFAKRFESSGVSPVKWCRSGYYLDERPDFIHDPLFHAGAYYVQEAASMNYETIIGDLGLTGPLKILDACAAPGGKTTAILNALGSDYVVVANEFDHQRVRILKENLDKWGDPNVIITSSPVSKFAALENYFDIVAVDAPCSGEGMMRREAVARSQWSQRLVEQCSSLQRDILKDAARALKEGAFLIYSTCTFNRRENEDNVQWLAEDLGMEIIGTPRHFMPHTDRCEGLFMALLKKPGDYHSSASPELGSVAERLKRAGIRIVGCGIEKTVRKGDIEIPSSRMVLARDFDRATFPQAELTREQALAYLRRQTITFSDQTPKGYVTVSFEGYPLGIVKNLGPRANNLYPPEWRILS